MCFIYDVIVGGKKEGKLITNRSMTNEEILSSLGYDVHDEADCKQGYDDGIECFYHDDNGAYMYDPEVEIKLDVYHAL